MTKSYTLTPEQEKHVQEELEKYSKPYADIAHLVFESEFDAGVFFEHELE